MQLFSNISHVKIYSWPKRYVCIFRQKPMVSFTITIPKDLDGSMSTNRPVRIFIVDDEFVISWSVGRILSAKGFETHTFTDPREALRNAPSEIPNLLITDVRMPEMSGIELAIKLQSVCPECKVLLMSGHTLTDELLESAREMGHAFDLLRKPVHPEVLLATVFDTVR